MGDCFNNRLRDRTSLVCLLLLAVAPFLVLTRAVTLHWVDVGYWDGWHVFGNTFVRFHKGVLSPTHLLAQHNESRKLFPRLLGLAVYLLMGKWDPRAFACLSLVFGGGMSIVFYVLLGRGGNVSRRRRLVLLVILNLFLFSLAKWDNWVRGIQFITLVPPFLAAVALMVNTSSLSFRTKVIVSALLAFIGTYTFSAGLTLWFVVYPYNCLGRWSREEGSVDKSDLVLFSVLYVAVAAFSLGFYFTDFHRPAGNPSWHFVVSHPLKAIAFFLNWLGAPFIPLRSQLYGSATIILGGVLLGTFVGLTGLITWAVFRGKPNDGRRLFPWFVFALYGLSTGAICTIGRAGFGIDQSAVPRYARFAMMLPIALVPMIHWTAQRYLWNGKRRGLSVIMQGALLTSAIFFLAYSSAHALRRLDDYQDRYLAGKLAVQYSRAVQSREQIKLISLKTDFVADVARQLDERGKLSFRLADPEWVQKQLIMDAPAPQGTQIGHVDRCVLGSDGRLRIEGWARNPAAPNQPAEGVLLVEERNGLLTPFATLLTGKHRNKVADTPEMCSSGFRGAVAVSGLLPGRTRFSVWALPELGGPICCLYHGTVDIPESVAKGPRNRNPGKRKIPAGDSDFLYLDLGMDVPWADERTVNRFVRYLRSRDERGHGLPPSVWSTTGWHTYRGDLRLNNYSPRRITGCAPAIADFSGQLAELGINFIFMPVPEGSMVYPDLYYSKVPLDRRGLPPQITLGNNLLFRELERLGVDYVNLTPPFILSRRYSRFGHCRRFSQRKEDGDRLTLWSPYGVAVSAHVLARKIKGLPWYKELPKLEGLRAEWVRVHGAGQQDPFGWRYRRNVIGMSDTQKDSAAIQDAPILVVGDANLHPSCDFGRQLMYELGVPVQSLMVSGGNPSVIAIRARKRPEWLLKRKLVVWVRSNRAMAYGPNAKWALRSYNFFPDGLERAKQRATARAKTSDCLALGTTLVRTPELPTMHSDTGPLAMRFRVKQVKGDATYPYPEITVVVFARQNWLANCKPGANYTLTLENLDDYPNLSAAAADLPTVKNSELPVYLLMDIRDAEGQLLALPKLPE